MYKPPGSCSVAVPGRQRLICRRVPIGRDTLIRRSTLVGYRALICCQMMILFAGVIEGGSAQAADIRPSGAAVPAAPAPIDKARAAITRKDWQVAIRELQSLVKAEPKNADAHNLLAFSLRNSGDLETAKIHYDEALKLDPDHKGAHEYIGELYLKLKQPENARKHLAILERLCGNKDCEEYRDLASALAQYRP